MNMETDWNITSSICQTCGTEVLRDVESGTEVHRDPAYDQCGVEGDLAPLIEQMYGNGASRRPGPSHPKPRHLRAVDE